MISHKYLNHGKLSVPAQKCSNLGKYNLGKYNQSLNSCWFPVHSYPKVRAYSTISPNDTNDSSDDQFIPAVIYEDASSMKEAILKDNAGIAGIYMLTNKVTGDIYVGQSVDLRKRFLNYFNLSYLNRRNELIICRAIIKYGYSNFSVTILEYCEKCDLDVREQHYFYTLNPEYNIQKIAGGSSLPVNKVGGEELPFQGSSKGLILSKETKDKISKALKGVYVGDKAYWYGRTMSAATREIMSSKRKGELNPLYGKSHSEESKELMRQKALGRKYSEETKLLMSSKRGNPVNIYEKCTSVAGGGGFKLIGSFVSARRAGKFLGISGSTILSYMKSGTVFKDRYKFSGLRPPK